MDTNFTISYISCGCNRTPHSADWSRNGLICFASCNSVIIYDPGFADDGGKILFTLHSNKERVNCVRWLRNNTSTFENEFISVSADGTGTVWSWDDENQTYTEEYILKGHTNIATIGDGIIKLPSSGKYKRGETPVIVATASIDSTVMIWGRSCREEIKCLDIINWSPGFCLDLKFTILPNTDCILLACAADDNKVHLFTEQRVSEIEKTNFEHKFYKIHVISGHDDWVRAMDFMCDDNNNLFLATASQDTYIRVHKFQKKADWKNILPKITNSNLKGVLEPEEKIIKISLGCSDIFFAVTLETVLAGHEGWIYGVSWHPSVYTQANEKSIGQNMEITGGFKTQKIKLLSSSMDKSMIIWSPNKMGIWSEETRVGEVGGSMLGFYGGKFGPEGKSILGHGYQGSFHIWSFDKKIKNWEPKVVVGGHTSNVMDLTWDLNSNYILSVGSDQTTRLHAPWVRNESNEITWHEIARPQIHGYDINCLAMLSEYKFASGADEKVIRAFTAPNNFIENFQRISHVKIDSSEIRKDGLPQGASVPVLGLSNKPVFEQMKKEGFLVDDEYPDLYFSPIYLKKPPTEENLMQNTLWPEAQKLYGHGYEIYSLAARWDGVILASSCKATSPEHAAIMLWNAKTWLQLQKLMSHHLTVTQMSFSPDGRYLLSVSRDRRWSLFVVQEDGKSYQLLAAADPKESLHTRVIWCCSWTYNSTIFATGSRDGKIGFWTRSLSVDSSETSIKLLTYKEFPKESVTALAFSPMLVNDCHILAVGLEKGNIFLCKYRISEVENILIIQGNVGHSLTVKRLAFRRKVGRAGVYEESEENSSVLQLASCGLDHIIKIYDIFLNLV